MGCCGSKDTDSEEEVRTSRSAPSHPSRDYDGPSRVIIAPSREIVTPSRGNVAPSRGNVAPSRINVAPSRINVAPSRGNVAVVRGDGSSIHGPTARSTNSRPIAPTWDQYFPIPPVKIYHDEVDIFHNEVGSIGHSHHHNEERHFFQIFFSVLDHVPGHQGIFRRWEREAQRAECESSGRCDMSNIWLEASGYVKSLQRVKMLVYNKKFGTSERAKLTEWAAKVVKRRAAEYKKAKAQGRADPKHLKVLEEWRGVHRTIQDLL